MKIRVTRSFEVERHDAGTDVETGTTDVRHLLVQGRYSVVAQLGGYVWLQDDKESKRIHYAIRVSLYALAVSTGVIVELGPDLS